MDIQKMVALQTVGQMALELHQAEIAVKSAKYNYHEKINEFECKVRTLAYGRIDKWDESNSDLIDFTAKEYKAYQLARRVAYNIKRRLANACRRVPIHHSLDSKT